MNHPLVSVCCIVYNHEAFLEQCLNGIVMQKTNFKYEIIVHDDASTDKSPTIIRDYYRRYPDSIIPILQTENQYSKTKSILPILIKQSSGKYIALCEGDDYWTDPNKLQKQVDYMNDHPECSLCFHNAMIHWYGKNVPDELYGVFSTGEFSGPDLIRNWISPTASFLFRSDHMPEYLAFREKHPQLVFGDIPMVMFLSQFGSIHGMSDVMSVYGKHQGGWTHSADATKMYTDGRSWEELRTAFKSYKPYKEITSDMVSKRYLDAFKQSIKERNLSIFLKAFYRGFIRQPIRWMKALFAHTEGKGRLN